MERVHEWNVISADFRNGLILGNGSSIAFDDRFKYESLKREAQSLGFLSPDVQRVFSHLATDDFELALKMLWHTRNINVALSIREPRSLRAYRNVRNALIRVVREIHPLHADVSHHSLMLRISCGNSQR